MQSELILPASWRARPRGFIALMQLYESNYLRLRRLCGDPALLRGEYHSQSADQCDLRVRVIDRSAYTVNLQLTHVFQGSEPDPVATALATYPDVRLRVYCDARLVQAQEWAESGAPVVPVGKDRELHLRWAYNIMLNKWLEYCLDRGYRFG